MVQEAVNYDISFSPDDDDGEEWDGNARERESGTKMAAEAYMSVKSSIASESPAFVEKSANILFKTSSRRRLVEEIWSETFPPPPRTYMRGRDFDPYSRR